MATLAVLARASAAAQALPEASDRLPFLRLAARALIAVLIAVLVTYIVIEQFGSWKRRRSGRG